MSHEHVRIMKSNLEEKGTNHLHAVQLAHGASTAQRSKVKSTAPPPPVQPLPAVIKTATAHNWRAVLWAYFHPKSALSSSEHLGVMSHSNILEGYTYTQCKNARERHFLTRNHETV